jgi:hypothetical protein
MPAPAAGPVEPPAAPAPPSEQSASGMTLAEATELLDLLERRGLELRSLDVGSDGRVTVRWVGPHNPEADSPAS